MRLKVLSSFRKLVVRAMLGVVAGPVFANAAGSDTGFVVLTTGRCKGTVGGSFALKSRNPDSILSKDYFGDGRSLDYEDDLGAGRVFVREIEARPDWKFYNHLIKWSKASRVQSGESPDSLSWRVEDLESRSRSDYAWNIRIESGKVHYLGRFCLATQNVKFKQGLLDRVQLVATNAYLIVGKNLERDLAIARQKEPKIAGLEVVDLSLSNPESITPLWRATWLEPRIIDMTSPSGAASVDSKS